MSAIDDLVPHLKKLRLSGILQSLELRLQQAREDSLPYEEFLFRLLTDEVERARSVVAALVLAMRRAGP